MGGLHYTGRKNTGCALKPKVGELAVDEIQLATIRSRIAERIRLAMRRRAYPATPVDAYKQLATSLGWDVSAVTHLVSGKVSPTLEQMIAIAHELQEPLCFFVDERSDPLPTGTTVVDPIGAGEPLVVRMPQDALAPRLLSHGLVYFYALRNVGFGIDEGDFVIVTRSVPGGALQQGHLYAFDEDGEIAVRICTEATGGRGVFKGDDASTRIAPAADEGDVFEHGRVVAVLRPEATVLRHATQGIPKKAERPTP